MEFLAKYRKTIVAVVGLVLFLIQSQTKVAPEIADYVIAILTAAGVYQVPNAAGQESVSE